MVVSPQSVLAAEVIGGTSPWLPEAAAAAGDGQTGTSGAVLWCDGRRRVDLPPGTRVEVRRGAKPVLLARLRGTGQAGDDGQAAAAQNGAEAGALFTDRLVAKFGLTVTGWRGQADARRALAAAGQREHGQREEGPSGDA